MVVSQTFGEKCEAIESLLELIWWHLDFVPGAVRVHRYGESEGGAGPGSLAPVVVDCNGRCFTCLAYWASRGKAPVCPPEEKWAREAAILRRRYRIKDVEDSVLRLAEQYPTQAQAVWAVYVEPWPDPKTEPISPSTRAERQALALEGITWMAHDIWGDVIGYGQKADPLENQIRELAAQGYTWKRIAKELRCSKSTIRRVLVAQESAVGG